MSSAPEWEELYQQALLELDEITLQTRISTAEAAVRKRLLDLPTNGEAGAALYGEERHRLEDALYSLQCLRRICPGRTA